MDLHAFTNRLKALRFIDRADLRDLTDNQWMAFRADPAGYLVTQGDDVAAKIWAVVELPFTTTLPPGASAEFAAEITHPAEPTLDLVAAGQRYAAEMGRKVAAGRLINHAKANQDFVAQVARMTTDAEMDGDMSGDDAVTTLSGLIEHARQITKGGES